MSDDQNDPPDHQERRWKVWLAMAGALVVTCVFLSLIGTHWAPGLVDWWRTRSWKEVPCKIVHVHLDETTTSKGSRRVMTKALYTYEAGGRERKGQRVSLITDWGGAYQAGLHARLRPYEISQEPFRCLVNPADPEDAILFRDLRWGLLLSLSIPFAMFPWLGAQVFWRGMTSLKKSWHNRRLRGRYPGQPWKWQPEWEGTSITASPDGLWKWVLACIWLAVIAVPLAFTVLYSGTLSKEPEAMAVFLPMAAVAWPLILARRRLRARQIMGDVSFMPEKWPAKARGQFKGRLTFTKPLPAGTRLMLSGRCQRETWQKGRSATPWVKVLWEKTWEVVLEEDGTALVDLTLPAHPRSKDASSDPKEPVYRWFLKVRTDDQMMAASLPLPLFKA